MPTPAASNPNRLGPKQPRRRHSPETAQIAHRQPKGRNRLEAETAWAHCLPWPFSMSPRGRFSALNAKGSVPRVCFDQKTNSVLAPACNYDTSERSLWAETAPHLTMIHCTHGPKQPTGRSRPPPHPTLWYTQSPPTPASQHTRRLLLDVVVRGRALVFEQLVREDQSLSVLCRKDARARFRFRIQKCRCAKLCHRILMSPCRFAMSSCRFSSSSCKSRRQ